MKQALIIFVRNPVPGKVKTRLAKTAGEEQTLEIYLRLLQHTRNITKELPCDKYLFYADNIGENDIWEDNLYYKELQQGTDLGEKMYHAFQALFEKGYRNVVIIGSDNMELTTAVIAQSFADLHRHDVVIGPSADGGYYLLGLTRMHNLLFQNMAWSTDKLLAETIKKCREASLGFSLLPMLHDIDDEAGWNRYLSSMASSKKIIFVYNADSGLFSTVTDYVHKLLSPSTYACSLCALTHHHAGMKQEWKAFVQQLPYKAGFLHKDEFVHDYPAYEKLALPAVFIQHQTSMQLLLSAETLNGFHEVDELKNALQHELKQYDLHHYTGI